MQRLLSCAACLFLTQLSCWADAADDLAAWVEDAKRRGTPVSWADLMTEQPPEETNGAPVLERSERVRRELLFSGDAEEFNYEILSADPFLLRTPIQDLALRTELRKLDRYFELLQDASERSEFCPRFDSKFPQAPDLGLSLGQAWRFLRLRGSLGGDDAFSSALWLAEVASKWRTRTWYESNMRDHTIGECLGLLRHVESQSTLGVSREQAGQLEGILAMAEGAVRRQIPGLLAARRVGYLWAAEGILRGEDGVDQAGADLSSLLGKATQDGNGELLTYLREHPDELLQGTLDLVRLFDVAIAASRDLERMRLLLFSGSVRASGPYVGDFERFLKLVADIRAVRLGLLIRAGEPTPMELCKRNDLLDPLSGRAFRVERVQGGWVVGSRPTPRQAPFGAAEKVQVADAPP